MKATTGLGLIAMGFAAIALSTGSIHAGVASVFCGLIAFVRHVREGAR